MPSTIIKTIGTQTVHFVFNTPTDAATYADAAAHAFRDVKAKLARAKKLTADAYARLPASHGTVADEFYDLIQRYFRLARPNGTAEMAVYKAALQRIQTCLTVTFDGIDTDGVIYAQLSDAKCGEGYKGQVPPTAGEGLTAWLFPDSHDFTKESGLKANMLIDFRMLASNYPLAVNTMIHEATHKFCVTWDHVYFGAGGQRINADQTWLANCRIRILMEDATNSFFTTTASRDMTRALASEELLRVMQASNAAAARRPDAAIVAEHAQAITALNAQGATAGTSAFATQKVASLTPKQALNNADSYSCYVVELPDAIVQ